MKTCRTEGPCSRSECDCGFYDKDHPMTARHSLDQIVRGLDGVTAGPVSVERLREVLNYDPETGVLTWKQTMRSGKNHNRVNTVAGETAGGLDALGYVTLAVDRKRMRAHRIAYAMHLGEWPKKQVDHINGDRADNRLSNLRLASNAENGWNRGRQKNNTSGFKGVTRATHDPNKWQAGIWANGRHRHLGYFNSPEEAGAAYAQAAKEIHGEYANV